MVRTTYCHLVQWFTWNGYVLGAHTANVWSVPSNWYLRSNYTRRLLSCSLESNATPLQAHLLSFLPTDFSGFAENRKPLNPLLIYSFLFALLCACVCLCGENETFHLKFWTHKKKPKNTHLPKLTDHFFSLSFFFWFHFTFWWRRTDTSDKSDQSTAETWWRSHITTPGADAALDSNFFSATHGLVQTHPALSGGIPRPSLSTTNLRAGPSNPSLLAVAAASSNSKSPFRHLDFASSATAELRRNPNLSAPDECARACREGEPPRICYYHFTLEYYTVLGA